MDSYRGSSLFHELRYTLLPIAASIRGWINIPFANEYLESEIGKNSRELEIRNIFFIVVGSWDGWIEAKREEDGKINIFHECDLSLRIPYVCFDHGIEVSVYFIERGRLTRATILS